MKALPSGLGYGFAYRISSFDTVELCRDFTDGCGFAFGDDCGFGYGYGFWFGDGRGYGFASGNGYGEYPHGAWIPDNSLISEDS